MDTTASKISDMGHGDFLKSMDDFFMFFIVYLPMSLTFQI